MKAREKYNSYNLDGDGTDAFFRPFKVSFVMLKESLGVPTPDLSYSEDCTTNRLCEAIVFTDVIPVCCTMNNQNIFARSMVALVDSESTSDD
jgi:hypothetical protein